MRTKLVNNKHRVNWLISLMTVSLLGITGIQAYWLAHSYQLEEDKFNEQVSDALQSVAKRVETLETIDFLYDNFSMEPLFSSKANPLVGFEGQRDSALKIEAAEGAYRWSVKFGRDSIEVFENQMESSPGLYYVNKDTSYRLALDDRQKLISKFRNMDAVFNQMIVRSFERAKGVENRMTERHLDSILDFELKSHGVGLHYEYVVTEDGEPVMASAKDLERTSSHQAALYPNDLFDKTKLMVSFPGKANYLLRSMWLTLLISILFTTAIIYTFWRTLSYSLQQKRISDIKTDFINNMTHEFKTPIATISLAIDALRNPKVISDKEKIKHYSEVIKQENNRMNMQVESVLRMALMDKKELQLDFAQVVVSDLLRDCIDHIGLQLESRKGILKEDFEDAEVEMMLDGNHFCNAVINILDNAIKYSSGAPEITIRAERTRENLILIISDKGIGMTKEEQKNIFDRFFRVASGDIHNIKGHGLGLSYARGIIEAHGGKISVESEKEKGSKFYIYLPLDYESQTKNDRY